MHVLKVDHLKIVNDKECVLIQDVSFCLPNRGIVSIYCNQEEANQAIAQVLSGIRKPQNGSLIYNEFEMIHFDEDERSMYRSTFVSSLYHNFQILKDHSVYQNITMGLEYPFDKIEHELKKWGLEEKSDALAEDLSTDEQWRMALLRCVLRQPMMLVLDVSSFPLSSLELEHFYTYLEELRTNMLIVIIGHKGSFPSSNRIIEFDKGYMISDSLWGEEIFPQINHTLDVFQLTRSNVEELKNKLLSHIRWKLRCASILCVVAFIALSTAVFSTTLDITDIQMRLMDKQSSTMFAIQKMAEKSEGSKLNNYYDVLSKKDVRSLNAQFKKDLILGYEPIDTRDASYYAYGTSIIEDEVSDLDEYTIVEAINETELGLRKIYGEYPASYQEVALSSAQAYELLEEQMDESYENSEEQSYKMLGKEVLWYGNTFEISGIFPSSSSTNINMEMDMAGYNGNRNHSGTLTDKTFFVKKGFVDTYGVLQSNTYQKSYKRMIVQSRVVSDFNHISTLDQDVYYYNGEDVISDHTISKKEVLVDFPMALDMGYRSTYTYGVDESSNVSFQQRIEEYQQFADQWIGKTVTIQTYGVENSPNSSTIMSENLKIKGFIIPMTYNYLERYVSGENEGCVYLNTTLANEYSTNNYYIKEAFYQSDIKEERQQALSYFNKQTDYEPYLINSTILQFFVVDLKNLNTLLIMIGSISLLISIAIFVFLLKSSIHSLRDQFSIFYLFGEKKSTLQKLIKKNFHELLWMRSLFGWFCGTLSLVTFILIIYFTLSSSPFIVWALCLPLLLLVAYVVLVRLAFSYSMKRIAIIEEDFIE